MQNWNALVPMTKVWVNGLPAGNVMPVMRLLLNPDVPMLANAVGSVTVPLSEVRFRKLLMPMVVTSAGMVSDVSALQPFMKLLGMALTPVDRDTFSIRMQSWRVRGPTLVTVFGKVKVPPNPLHPRRQLYETVVTLEGMVTEVSPVQPRRKFAGTTSMPADSDTLAAFVHPMNAEEPLVVTLSFIVMLRTFKLSRKASVRMATTSKPPMVAGITSAKGATLVVPVMVASDPLVV